MKQRARSLVGAGNKLFAITAAVAVHILVAVVLFVNFTFSSDEDEVIDVSDTLDIDIVNATTVDEQELERAQQLIAQKEQEKKREEELQQQRLTRLALEAEREKRRIETLRQQQKEEERRVAATEQRRRSEEIKRQQQEKLRLEAEKQLLEAQKKRREVEEQRRREEEQQRIAEEKRLIQEQRVRVQKEELERQHQQQLALQQKLQEEEKRLADRERALILERQKEKARREQEEKKKQEAQSRFGKLIDNKIKNLRTISPETPKGLRTVLRVRMNRDGEVQTVEIVRSSGNLGYDHACETAVLKASPLPIPPYTQYPQLNGRFTSLRINLDY